MSWLQGMASGEEPKPYKEPPTAPLVQDPSQPDRLVSNKPANKPFLAHKAHRAKQEKLHEEWLQRKKEREEKIARGEEVGPEEKDPTASEEVGVLGLLKFIGLVLLLVTFTGKFITGSFLWEYDGKWVQMKTYFPQPKAQRLFSEALLSQFDGTVPGRPIYLAIDGDVYDVTTGAAYQPGGSYHRAAGVDAARAFITGCFGTESHRSHDLRGFTEEELQGIAHWKNFYKNHKEYKKIGRVSHAPIDPNSPIPIHCDPKKQEAYEKRIAEEAEKAAAANKETGRAEGEL